MTPVITSHTPGYTPLQDTLRSRLPSLTVNLKDVLSEVRPISELTYFQKIKLTKISLGNLTLTLLDLLVILDI
jgi:hypothetical protein